MRNDKLNAGALLATSVALVSMMAACVTPTKPRDVEAFVLADATARSASYCASYKDGCRITVRHTERGVWTASVEPYVRALDETPLHGIDLDDFYIYSTDGSFESALRNYR